MASVYRNPGRLIWMMAFRVDGKLVRKSSGTRSKMKAQQMADDLETDKRRGLPVQVGKVTLDEAADLLRADYRNNEYRSLKKFDGTRDQVTGEQKGGVYLNHLRPYFGGRTKLTAIRAGHITAYVNARVLARGERRNPSNGTINREVGYVQRMFELAAAEELILYKPGHFMKLDESGTARTGFLEKAQFEDICSKLTATTWTR